MTTGKHKQNVNSIGVLELFRKSENQLSQDTVVKCPVPSTLSMCREKTYLLPNHPPRKATPTIHIEEMQGIYGVEFLSQTSSPCLCSTSHSSFRLNLMIRCVQNKIVHAVQQLSKKGAISQMSHYIGNCHKDRCHSFHQQIQGHIYILLVFGDNLPFCGMAHHS